MGGASSKQTFSKLVQALLEKEIKPDDHEFWDELWRTVLTPQEVFEIISPDDVRKLIIDRPSHVKTLFTQAVAQLYQLVETPYPVYFEQALNCMRILSRVLPFLLESDEKYVWELLWNKRMVKNQTAGPNGEEGKGEEAVEADSSGNLGEIQESEPLAVILINTIFHLMFLPDLTVEDPGEDFNESDVNSPAFKAALMWAPGVGSSEKTITMSTQFDSNRMDVLRLLITACCDSLYQTAEQYDPCKSLWLEVATSSDAPYADMVFYSLLNTVLGYDPVGWGIPYSNMLASDTAKQVMEHATHTLCILLDYGHPIHHSHIAANTTLPYIHPQNTDAQGFNIYRKLLCDIHSPADLQFIYTGFVRLLHNVYEAENTYLPHSITCIHTQQELLVLLWKFIEEVPAFLPYILKHGDVNELLVPICYFLLEGRKDPAKAGLMYLCTFMLLKLSGERNFGVMLNKPYSLRLPVDVPLFSGNHADLLVVVLHKMIVSGTESLSALYSCFLTIICNISPYCKALSSVAAVKLVNLFCLFVSPKFLYAAEGNHVYVGLLLETFNNIVQYQYEGNGNLIFGIIRKKEAFEGLAGLTLPAAIKHAKEEVEKQQEKRAKKGAKHALASRKNSEDMMEVPPSEMHPTSLITTHNVERRVDTQGEVTDLQTAEAQQRTPMTPDRKVEEGPARKPASSHTHNHAPKFVPTDAWLQAVKSELPLATIMRLLKHLVPQIEELGSKQVVDEKAVVDFLHSTTMVGLLPVPHPIVIRKYQPNKYTCLWFTAYMWGVVFMHNQAVPLFDGKKVKLFMVQTA